MSQEFVVNVKRKSLVDDTDLWTASVNGQRFEAITEESLRCQVRTYLLNVVAKNNNKTVDDYTASLRRTWWVHIKECAKTDDEPEPFFSLFD